MSWQGTLAFGATRWPELLGYAAAFCTLLYFQNPKFGFYLLQLISHRLLKDVEKLESALARTTRACAAKGSG